MKMLPLIFLFFAPIALFAQQADNDSTHWQYDEVADPMSNSVIKYAKVYSQNSTDLKSPYDGGTKAFIEIANVPRPNGKPTYHMVFGITKGQIGDNILQYKFDAGKALYWGAIPLTDDNLQVRIPLGRGFDSRGVNAANEFVNSAKLLVAVTVYDNGLQYFYFDTSGLDLSRLN